ncbi:hypothetical protein DBR06_SOUSAS26410011, partial [Sousa chinensis]
MALLNNDCNICLGGLKINKKTGLQGDGVLLHQGWLWAPDLPLVYLVIIAAVKSLPGQGIKGKDCNICGAVE